jgi:hypothetical protein
MRHAEGREGAAAPHGSSPACLVKGVGVERDEQPATAWLRHVPEGLPEAQYMYGEC